MKGILFSILFFTLFHFTYAQHHEGLLWRVKKGSKTTGYVFGTMHLSDRELISWSESIYACLDSSDIVAGELEMSSMQASGDLMSKLMMKDSTLADLLSPEDYRSVKLALEDHPLAFLVADQMKPFFTMAMLELDRSEVELDSAQSREAYVYSTPDGRVQEYGLSKGKCVIGLETMEDQINAVDKISYRDQAELLKNMLLEENDSVSEKPLVDIQMSMKESYMRQNLKVFQELMIQIDVGAEMTTYLLNERNSLFALKMKASMQSNVCFLAVGALHLPGEQGVLSLLQKEGYKVERVPLEFLPVEK